MSNAKRTELVTREAILNLLSNNELAKVTTDEAKRKLTDGEDYLDLLHLDLGVLKAKSGVEPNIGNTLPRQDVQPTTWTKILAQLAR